MSKGQTKKKANPDAISTLEIPFSSQEKKALRAILAAPYWNRRGLKDKFMAEWNRLPEDVDAYMMANGKRKGKTEDKPEPKFAKGEPKAKLVAKIRGGEPLSKKSGTPSELRVPFTGLRIEGDILIIEYKR